MPNYNRFTFLFLVLISFYSCKDEAKKNTDKNNNKEVTIAIDSSAFRADKKNYELESVIKETKASSQAEVEALVKDDQQDNLNKYQLFAQGFLTACAKKDYKKAATYLAYKGSDASRNNKAPYNVANANEMSIVKTTVDVVFGFLAESSNYKFATTKEKPVKVGMAQDLEITFFKKGLGINRHFFEVIDTPNGMLIYDMK